MVKKYGRAHCERLAVLKIVKSVMSRRAGSIPVSSAKNTNSKNKTKEKLENFLPKIVFCIWKITQVGEGDRLLIC